MAKELVTEKDSNYFLEYGKQAGFQGNIVGKLLRFTKGEYVAGQDNEEIEEDTKVIVNMDSVLSGWTRWEDNKPAEQLMGPIAEGFQPAKRAELGHDDESLWEQDPNGNARDPWQFGNLVIMKTLGKKGELFTFTTASKGGIGAIGRLCTEYGKEMRERPDEYPVVTLGVDSYMHTTYGKIKFPKLVIVDWADKSNFADLAADEPAPTTKRKQLKSRAA